jgi:hypothetical protein
MHWPSKRQLSSRGLFTAAKQLFFTASGMTCQLPVTAFRARPSKSAQWPGTLALAQTSSILHVGSSCASARCGHVTASTNEAIVRTRILPPFGRLLLLLFNVYICG